MIEINDSDGVGITPTPFVRSIITHGQSFYPSNDHPLYRGGGFFAYLRSVALRYGRMNLTFDPAQLDSDLALPGWRKWQTRKLEVLVSDLGRAGSNPVPGSDGFTYRYCISVLKTHVLSDPFDD